MEDARLDSSEMDVLNHESNDTMTRTCHDAIGILKEQASTLHRLEGHMKKDTNSDIREDEWNILAKVLDRIFLIIYMCVSVTVFLVFFIKMAENQHI